jgi:hypothetical protein
MNAPLPQLAPPEPTGPGPGSPFPQGHAPRVYELPPGYMACPHCRVPMIAGAPICPACKVITSPDGIYHGPKVNAPGAVQSLVYGIVGLVFCQIILGPIAISKASAARRAMAADPTLGGEGLATAGTVMGVIDLVVFVIGLSVRMSSM